MAEKATRSSKTRTRDEAREERDEQVLEGEVLDPGETEPYDDEDVLDFSEDVSRVRVPDPPPSRPVRIGGQRYYSMACPKENVWTALQRLRDGGGYTDEFIQEFYFATFEPHEARDIVQRWKTQAPPVNGEVVTLSVLVATLNGICEYYAEYMEERGRAMEMDMSRRRRELVSSVGMEEDRRDRDDRSGRRRDHGPRRYDR